MSSQISSKQATSVSPVLSDADAHKMLKDLNLFCGMSFNGMNGPCTSSRQIAEVRNGVCNSVRPSQAISTEEFYPANEVDARSTHIGWPTLGALPGRPWDVMNQDTKGTITGNWVCRRMVINRYTVSLRPEDLKPCDAFVKEVEAALNEPTYAERMQALRRTCGVWGEMVPLDFVIGASMSSTGTLAANQNLTGDASTFRPADRGPDVMQMIDRCLDITNNFDKRFESRIQGGYPEMFSKSGFDAWLCNATNIDNSSTWEVVKVNRAVPITDLLPKALRLKVERMCSYIVTRPACVGSPVPLNFDGGAQGLKDIKRINVWHNGATIQDLSITYVDDTVCGPYAFGKGKEPTDTFALHRDEYLTNVWAWTNASDVFALQFAKNTGQVSNICGGPNSSATPYVLSGNGDALLGMSGTFTATTISQIQPVWRGDVVDDGYRQVAVTHTGYYGMNYGATFNDYAHLGDASTSCIKQIKWRAAINLPVGQFQVTYASDRGGRTVEQESPIRGTEGGAQSVWTLGEGEYIKKVRVKRNVNWLYMLEFTTTKGNVQRMGQDAADEIIMEPPHKDMVLSYMMGRCHSYMQWMTFVWCMPPSA